MKKSLSIVLVCFLANAFCINTVFAERTFSTSGTVESIDRKVGKIKVSGKRYRLARDAEIFDVNHWGEVEPVIKKGDEVGLVFVRASSKSSGVKEVWLLSGAKR